MTEETPPKRKGGRPRGDPKDIRAATIGVRVSPAEYETLKAKAEQMGMTPAQFLRDAALKRRLPSPPVPARRPVTVAEVLLEQLTGEVSRLRLALLGVEGEA